MLIAEVSCIIFVLWLTPFQEVRKHTDLEQQAQVNEYIWMVTWNFCDPILTSWGRRGNPMGSRSHWACSWLGGTKVDGISIPLLHKQLKLHQPKTQKYMVQAGSVEGMNGRKAGIIIHHLQFGDQIVTDPLKHLSSYVQFLVWLGPSWHDPHNIVSSGLQAHTTWEPTMRTETRMFSGQFPGPG